MELLKELNETQGTTFVVVTHDLNVARQTRRVVVMADGKIVREDNIGSPIEEDLKIWQHSGLGRHMRTDELTDHSQLLYSPEQIAAISAFLNQNNGGVTEASSIQNVASHSLRN